MLLAVWFDAVFRGLQTGSPRTGWGERLSRWVGCCGLCGSTRSGEYGGRLTTNGGYGRRWGSLPSSRSLTTAE